MTDTPTSEADTDTDATAEWLTDPDTIEATITRSDAPDLPIEVRDITRDELVALEERSEGGPQAEEEAIRHAIREYLVEPDVDPDTVVMRKRQMLFVAMQRAWSGEQEIRAAMEELELPGNRGRR